MNANINGNDLKNKGKKITLGDKDYELIMDFNAICDMENKYGDVNKAFEKIEQGKMEDVRFLLAAMMRHSDDSITEREVGKLITSENMQEVFDALGGAMSGSLPEGEEKNAVSPQI